VESEGKRREGCRQASWAEPQEERTQLPAGGKGGRRREEGTGLSIQNTTQLHNVISPLVFINVSYNSSIVKHKT
jgi:hypothetical protein